MNALKYQFDWVSESSTPSEYRLGIRSDGSLALMGKYEWQGFNNGGELAGGGCEWRELPTINIVKDKL